MRNPWNSFRTFQNQLLGSNLDDKNLRHTVQNFRIQWSTRIQVTMSRHVKAHVTISQVQSFDVPAPEKLNKTVRFGSTYAPYHDLILPTRGSPGTYHQHFIQCIHSQLRRQPCRRACAHTRTKADKPVEKTARSTIKNQCTAIAKSPKAE